MNAIKIIQIEILIPALIVLFSLQGKAVEIVDPIYLGGSINESNAHTGTSGCLANGSCHPQSTGVDRHANSTKPKRARVCDYLDCSSENGEPLPGQKDSK